MIEFLSRLLVLLQSIEGCHIVFCFPREVDERVTRNGEDPDGEWYASVLVGMKFLEYFDEGFGREVFCVFSLPDAEGVKAVHAGEVAVEESRESVRVRACSAG